ncbi:MAG: hypothetical protein AAF745_08040 [Planctomycetota bacterium]
MFIIATGCARDSPSPTQPTSRKAAVEDPKTLLMQAFDRYQHCASYHDRGRAVLRMRSEVDQRQQTVTAPLRVWYDRGDLSADAYTLRIRVRSLETPQPRWQLQAWFDEPATSDFDHQLLQSDLVIDSKDPASRLPLDPILADEILRARLSAGLAGPPPQLEWLLAEDPMQRLFETDSTFERLTPAERRGRMLERVMVRSNREEYVFWIDPSQRLILRVELPAPLDIARIDASASLSLELDDAAFTSGSNPNQTKENPPLSEDIWWTVSASKRAKTVSRFVPLPPLTSPLIGRTVSTNGWLMPVNVSRDGLIVIVRMPDSQANWPRVISHLKPVLSRLTKTDRVGWIAPDRAASRSLNDIAKAFSNTSTVVINEPPAKCVRDLRLSAGSVAIIDAQHRVLMVQLTITRQTIEFLSAAIDDARAGGDVAQRILQAESDAQKRYRALLDDAIKRN